MERLDAHQHFWRYNPSEYGWIGDDMAALRRDFLPADLAAAQAPVQFTGSIAVQARQTLEETRWLLDLAAHHKRIRGVVGWVDLRSEALEEQLDEFVQHRAFVGVRHVVHDEPDDTWLLRADVQRGLEQLHEYGLTYDLLLFPKHLRVAVEVARRFPDQRFVLDNLAKPFIRDGIRSPWDRDVAELAACENVACKLSGVVTEADWRRWRPADLRPYLDVVFAAFGEDRVMIGSDWPVCTVAGDYATVTGAVIDWAGQFPAATQARILGGTCARWYLNA